MTDSQSTTLDLLIVLGVLFLVLSLGLPKVLAHVFQYQPVSLNLTPPVPSASDIANQVGSAIGNSGVGQAAGAVGSTIGAVGGVLGGNGSTGSGGGSGGFR